MDEMDALRVKVTTMSALSHDPSIDFAIGVRVVAIRYLRTCQGHVVHLNWIVISASRSSVSPLAVSLTRSRRKGSTHERAATIIPRFYDRNPSTDLT